MIRGLLFILYLAFASSSQASPLPRVTSEVVILGHRLELFDALDRDVTTNSAYRNYRHQPSVVRAPNGDLVALMRAGTLHSQPPDHISLIRSKDDGTTWSDRRSELIVLGPTDPPRQQVAVISRVGTRLWITGVDAQTSGAPVYPSRTSWTLFSDDSGFTWSQKLFNIPNLGTMHTTFGLARGIFEDPFHPSVLYVAGYYRNFIPGTLTQETRYTAVLLHSLDEGQTWSIQGKIAQDGPDSAEAPPWRRQFEEPYARFVGDVDGHLQALIRVDKGATDAAFNEKIYQAESWDWGQTWSAPVIAFPGRGTTPWLKTHGGVWVAATRSPFIEPTQSHVRIPGARGVLWMSDDFITWRQWRHGAGEDGSMASPFGQFQEPEFTGVFDGGWYMGADILEVEPDHIGIIHSQETNPADPTTRCGLYWDDAIVLPSMPIPRVHYRSESALDFTTSDTSWLDYGAQTTLHGRSEWTIAFRHRFKASSSFSGGWAEKERPILSIRNASPVQGQLIISQLPNRRFQIAIAASLTTWSFWTTPFADPHLINNSWTNVAIMFREGSLRVAFDGDEVELMQFGAFPPVIMTSPLLANTRLGTTTGGPNDVTLRSTQIDDLLILPSGQLNQSQLLELGSRGDKTALSFGPPLVWLRMEESQFADSMGAWPAPTLHGAPALGRRSLQARSWVE